MQRRGRIHVLAHGSLEDPESIIRIMESSRDKGVPVTMLSTCKPLKRSLRIYLGHVQNDDDLVVVLRAKGALINCNDLTQLVLSFRQYEKMICMEVISEPLSEMCGSVLSYLQLLTMSRRNPIVSGFHFMGTATGLRFLLKNTPPNLTARSLQQFATRFPAFVALDVKREIFDNVHGRRMHYEFDPQEMCWHSYHLNSRPAMVMSAPDASSASFLASGGEGWSFHKLQWYAHCAAEFFCILARSKWRKYISIGCIFVLMLVMSAITGKRKHTLRAGPALAH